ncbi:VCBS domain-containing protein, partial [Kiloniella majae]|uniref:VCBS domain-containing protein n=1 Tax=Kiloniella majae TaxID=1938558 RepID=UPI000A278805
MPTDSVTPENFPLIEDVVTEDTLATGSGNDPASPELTSSVAGIVPVLSGVVIVSSYDGAFGAATQTGLNWAADDGSWSLTLDANGAYSFVLSAALSHNDGATMYDLDQLQSSFGYTVQGAGNQTDTGNLIIKVNDDGPQAIDDIVPTITEDSSVVVDVLANDVAGADGVDLATDVKLVTAASKGTVVYNADGTFTYTTNAGAEGADSFSYEITDGDGDKSIATVSLTIGADSVPTLASVNGTVDESALSTGTNAASDSETTSGDFAVTTGNDSLNLFEIQDAQGNWVNVTAGGSIAGVHGGVVVSVNSGIYSWSYTLSSAADHSTSAPVEDNFSVRVTDSDGDQATGTLDVTITDDGPVASDDSVVANEGAVLSVTAVSGVLGNDQLGADGGSVTAVIDGSSGIPVAANIGQAIETSLGFLTLHADGSYDYTAKAGITANAQDSFTYQITDGDGDSTTATLVLNVTDSIPSPVAEDVNLLVTEDSLANGSGNDPVSNTEIASGLLSIANGNISNSSYNGTLGSATQNGLDWTADDGSWTFSLDNAGNYAFTLLNAMTHALAGQSFSNDQLTGSFGYVVEGDGGPSASGTILIAINDDGPVANADHIIANEGGNLTISAPSGVLANDVFGADGGYTVTAVAIGNGTPLAINIGQPLETPFGFLTLNADGAYNYAAKAGVLGDGVDSFTYQITDGDGDVSTASGTLNIEINKAPVLDTLPDGVVAPGNDIWVNDDSSYRVTGLDITTMADGRILSTWTAGDTAYGRFYSSEGNALGDDFELDQRQGTLRQSNATALEDGGFVLTWGNLYHIVDGSASGITARVFNADGSPRGDEYTVNNTYAVSEQYYPQTAALADGGYVITWHDHHAYMRVFNADGSPRIDQTHVHDLTLSANTNANVVGLPDGNYIVSWTDNTVAPNGTVSTITIQARVFTPDGQPLTEVFQVNEEIQGTQEFSSITALANGDFVVVWQSNDPDVDGNSHGEGFGLAARIFNADGSPQSGQFTVNAGAILNTTDDQINPDITALTTGGFIVTWGVDSIDGVIGVQSLMARVFDANGQPITGEFPLTSDVNVDSQPYVTGLDDGGFAVTWLSKIPGRVVHKINTRVFDFGSGERAYTEGEDPVLLAPHLTATDVDSATLSGATVSISSSFIAGQDVLSWAGSAVPAGVTAVYDAATGVLSFTGQASLAQYQALLGTVGYSNSSITPDQSQRSVSFQVVDEHGAISNEIIKLVNVHEIADPGAADLVDVASETLLVDGAGNEVFNTVAAGEAFVENGVIVSTTYDGSLGAATQNGLSWNADDGSWSFTLDRLGNYQFTILKPELIADTEGSAAFGYTVDSLYGPAENATITITINDDGPTAYADSNAVVEGATVSLSAQYGVLANDVLGEGGATVSAIAIGNGALQAVNVGQSIETSLGYLTLNADGSYSYSAKSGISADSTDHFTYQITAANGDVSTSTLSLSVVDAGTPNTAPVLGTLADGSVVPTSLDFAVNGSHGSYSYGNDITTMPDGRLLSVWTMNGDVFGRFYSPEGVPLENNFVLDHRLGSNLNSPSVTGLEDGGFVATWQNLFYIVDGSASGISARAFNADGTPRGDEFTVNTHASGEQYAPETASLADGGYVMTWHDYQAHFKVFNADGSARTEQITTTGHSNAEVIGLPDGNFVVTWTKVLESGPWVATNTAIHGQVYTPDGQPLGAEFQVNQQTEDLQDHKSIIALTNGNFVISWQTNDPDIDGNGYGISARIFNAAGIPLSNEFTLNAADITGVMDDQLYPQITPLTNGGFVATWGVDSINGVSGIQNLVARVFDQSGQPITDEFYVTDDDRINSGPTVTGLIDGGFAISWQSKVDGLVTNDIITRVFDFGSGVRAYGEGDDAVLLAPNLTATDADSDVLSGATVAISGGFVAGQDILSWSSSILPEGVSAVYDAATGVLTFTGVASLAEYQAILGTVGYENSSSSPDLGQRTVGFKIIDDHGAMSNEIIKLVNVFDETVATASNLAPVIDQADSIGSVIEIVDGAAGENATTHTATGSIVFADADTLDTHSISFAPDASGYLGSFTPVFDQATKTITWDFSIDDASIDYLAAGEVITQTYTVTIDDGNGGTVDQNVTVTITGTNDAPVISDNSDLSTRTNTTLAGDQGLVSTSGLEDGGWVVTWSSKGQDGSSWGIYGQAYNADGSAQGGEFQINSYTSGTQAHSNVVGLSDGGWVVTWTSDHQDGSYKGIFGQAYNADGTPQGSEFRANATAYSDQMNSSVAALTDGGWVVTWQSWTQDGSYMGVYGQVYNADGSKQGGEFRANTYTNNQQSIPTVTGLEDGGFVVTWNSLGQSGSGYSVHGQTYNADGSARGSEFQISSYPSGDQSNPSVASLSDGGWIVTWVGDGTDPSSYGIYAQAYNADGTPQGSEFQVNSYTDGNQTHPFATGLEDGGWVITWESPDQDGSGWGIYAQMYNADGTARGSEVLINDHTAGDQIGSAISGLPDGGWVISWTSNHENGVDENVYTKVYNADGTVRALYTEGGSELVLFTGIDITDVDTSDDVVSATITVTDFVAGDQLGLTSGYTLPAGITLNYNSATGVLTLSGAASAADYEAVLEHIAYSFSAGNPDSGDSTPTRMIELTVNDGNDNSNVITKVINVVGNDAPVITGGDHTGSVIEIVDGTAGENAITHTATGSIVFADADTLDTHSISFAPDASGYLGSFTPVFDQATKTITWDFSIDDASIDYLAAGEVITQTYTVTIDDGNGGTVDQNVTVTITGTNDAPVISDNSDLSTRTNTTLAGDQGLVSTSGLEDGGWVVTWSSKGQDGSSWGIYGQAYNADGSAQGGEFQINSYTSGTQAHSNVVGLSDGGWVVTWTSDHQDGSYKGIFGQAYNADGTPQGSEFRANATAYSDQMNSSVAALTDGGWVVTWQSWTQDGSYMGVYGQVYNADGSKQGGEFRANTYTNNQQSIPTVTGLEDGGFVVTWNSLGQSGSGYSVHGQTYNADGSARGSEFQISSYPSGDQSNPSVASLSDGGWIVTWVGDGTDPSSYGIYAQAYNADGTPQGSEFQVNSYTDGNQTHPFATGLEDGGWVITWESPDQDGSGWGIYAQMYNADGTARGSEVLINDHTAGDQIGSAISGLPDGGWVISWTSNHENGVDENVYTKVYNADGTVRALYTEGGSELVLFTGIDITDVDTSDDVVSATITVTDFVAGDQLGLTSGYTLPAGITLNYNSATGVLTLSGAASAADYEAVLEHIAYSFSAGNPDSGDSTPTRMIELTVNDGNDNSNVITKVINVVGNDAPVITGGDHTGSVIEIVDGTAGENAITHTATGSIVFADADTLDTHSISFAPDTSGYLGSFTPVFDQASKTITWDFSVDDASIDYLAAGEVITQTYTVTVDDGNGGTVDQDVTVTITGTNDAPVITDNTPDFDGDQLVNTTVEGNQTNPEVTGLANGGWVITWQSLDPSDNSYGVYSQVYDANGVKVDSEEAVFHLPYRAQGLPDITSLEDGGWVVTWSRDGGGINDIYGQVYNVDGSKRDSEFVVTTSPATQSVPSIGSLSDGGWVVTWQSDLQDGHYSGVFAQAFNADGTKQGGEFQVNTFTLDSQRYPDVAGLEDGGWVITWQGRSYNNSQTDIFGQAYNADGSKRGGEVLINTYEDGLQYVPSVTGLAGGGWVVTWDSHLNQDGHNTGTFAQVFNADGSKLGSEFQVNTHWMQSQEAPSVASLTDGGWVITWQDTGGQDGSGLGIFAQAFNADGTKQGGEFQVNDYTPGFQWYPTVAGLSDGGWVITWQSQYQDGDKNGIYSKSYNADGTVRSSNTYTEDGVELKFFTGVDIADVDLSDDIVSATITITDHMGGDQLALSNGYTLPTGVSVTYDSNTGILVITGSASREEYEAIIANVTYSSTSDYPDAQTTRTVELSVNDGNDNSNAVTKIINVVGVNDAPVITGGDHTGSVIEVGDGVVGENTATHTASGSIVFDDPEASDAHSISSTPDASGYLGSFTPVFDQDSKTITWDFSVDDTSIDYLAAGEVVTQTYTVTIDDGNGGTVSQDVTMIITGTNDAPVITDNSVHEFRVNTYTNGNQASGYVSNLADGGWIVSWHSSEGQDGSYSGIYAQAYNADGSPQGSEFRANATTYGAQWDPIVTGLSDGGWVIAWNSWAQDGSESGVFSRVFNADGSARGSEFRVNSYTSSLQWSNSIADLTDGGWVVSWSSENQDGSGFGVFAQAYNADGSKQGSEFQVNSYTNGDQIRSSITGLSDGGWVVTWHSTAGQDGSDHGVYGQAYNADGTKQGGEFQVNSYTTDNQYHPKISSLSDGGWVITWNSQDQDGSSYGVYGQAYNADGSTKGAEFQIHDETSGEQSGVYPSGLLDGGWVAVWVSDYGNNVDVYGQIFNPDGTKLGTEFQINDYTADIQGRPSITTLSDGRFVVTWNSENQDGSGYGTYSKVFNADGSVYHRYTEGGSDLTLFSDIDITDVDTSDDVVSATITVTDFVVGDQLGLTTGYTLPVGITLNYNSATGVLTLSGAASAADYEAVLEHIAYSFSAGNPDSGDSTPTRTIELVVNDGNDNSNVITKVINVVGNDAPVITGGNHTGSVIEIVDGVVGENTATHTATGSIVFADADTLDTHSISSTPDASGYLGSFTPVFDQDSKTITWDFSVDDTSIDYLAAGEVVTQTYTVTIDDGNGGTVSQDVTMIITGTNDAPVITDNSVHEFRVNTYTNGNQASGYVSNLADGGWIVSWHSSEGQDGSYSGIYAQAYNADGSPQGSEFRANATTYGAQWDPIVTGLSDGGWVIAWNSWAQDGSESGVFSRVFNADGSARGSEFRVNSYTSSLQWSNSIADLTDGGWVVSWSSENQDGSGFGVFAQAYNADGSKQGSEFQVNSYTNGDQIRSSITGLSDGGWVVTWHSTAGQDGSDHGVYGQAYNADGTKQGGEFQVNSYTTDNQYHPKISSLSDGGWVITWNSQDQDGSSYGVYGQAYNADGSTKGAEFQIHDETSGEQSGVYPSGLLDGGWVAVWVSDYGNNVDVYGQIFNPDGTKLGTEFQINDYTADIQGRPSITTLSDGRFVVTWNSENQDGSGYGTYSKVFNADGSVYHRYTEGGSDLTLFSDIDITDVDTSDDVVSATITVTDFVAGDQLGLTTGYTLPAGITLNYNSATGVLTLSGAASAADYETVLENITFSSVGESDGATVTRTIELSVNDGTDNSNIITKVINVTGTNDSPVITSGDQTVMVTEIADGVAGENATTHAVSGSITFADADISDIHSISVTPDVSGYLGSFTPVLDQATKTITWDFSVDDASIDYLAAGEVVTQTYTVTIDDGNGGTVDQDVTVTITGANDAPMITDTTSDYNNDHLVNTTTDSDQTGPAVTGLVNGGWVITWQSLDPSGHSYTIYAQVYDRNGTKAGSEEVIFHEPYRVQYLPEITALDDGGWVITWGRDGAPSGNPVDIYGQVYNADGSKRGEEFAITTSATTHQNPQIDSLADGGWIVTWQSAWLDGHSDGISAQAFNADGTKKGDELQVNTFTLGDQRGPDVTGLDDGGWIITWQGLSYADSQTDIYGQAYNADGSMRGGEIVINTYEDGLQYSPSVTSLANGGWIITWSSHLNQDGDKAGIFAQVYNADGSQQGSEFQVNTHWLQSQEGPSVASLTDGGWIVVWQSEHQDGSGLGIFGQAYNADGSRQGSEFQVNDYTPGAQWYPDVAGLADGGFIVTWQSQDQDGDQNGIYSKSYYADGTIRSAQTYTEGDAALQIFSGVDITDVDTSDDIVSATITVTDFVAGDQLGLTGSYTLPAGITLNYNSATGVLTLSGAASVADYEAVLEHIGYSSIAGNPDSGDSTPTRTIELTVNDGDASSNAITKVINVVGNDDPVITSGDQTGSVTEDTGTTHIVSGSIVFADADTQDVHSISFAPDVSGYHGSFTPVLDQATKTITWDFSVDDASIDYLAAGEVVTQTYTVTIDDGNGGTVDQDVTVTITGTNDAPVISESIISGGAEDIQVNSYTAGEQYNSSVAGLPDGGWVVVWDSQGQNGSSYGVYGQVYNADGSREGSEFQIDTITPTMWSGPVVTGLTDGGWVVTWHTHNQDGNNLGITAQAYHADGTTQGAQVQVNDYAAYWQGNNAITGLSDGG